MADEEAVAAEPPPADEGGGKSKILIIVIALVLVLGLGGGAAVYFVVLPKMKGGEQAGEKGAFAEKEAGADMASLGETIELPPFIVNLSGGTGRYLKVTLVLKLSTDKVAEEIKNREPQIKDAVITVLSSKSSEEILSVQGKYDLKGEIMKRINVFLSTGVVRELYFVEFVVQ